MTFTGGYKLIRLRNGAHCVHSLAHHESMHPGLGPGAEAEALYVRQLDLRRRLQSHSGTFTVWDVGLGAAANALAVLRATRDLACPLRIVSFDNTAEPLAFALAHQESLGYFHGYESVARTLLEKCRVEFPDGAHGINWSFQLGDFPAWLARNRAETEAGAANLLAADGHRRVHPPHAVLFDAFSPARNPAMWTLAVLTDLFHLLDPQQPCVLATYSRSTMFRVTLLLAGFFVGRGQAMGLKEETTVAANTIELIVRPLDQQWLGRARRSRGAEPLIEPRYRQAPLLPESWAKLQAHPQFAQVVRNPPA